MDAHSPPVSPYGLLAEFDSAQALVDAAARTHEEGYRDVDAYSPFPIEAMHHALHLPNSKLPIIVFIGGALGAIGGFGLQFWASAINYPLNIGGRPLNSWVAFIPVTFESTILLAAISAVVGMFLLNDLPRPHHPVFAGDRFDRASQDRFFLCIEATDPKFDPAATERFLTGLGAAEVTTLDG